MLLQTMIRPCLLLIALFIPFNSSAMPTQIDPPGEKVVIVDPNEHVWAAYAPNGVMVHSGVAAAGANYCKDMQQQCHTQEGRFRIRSLGSSSCVSPSFPMPTGGAPMPYCMYFNELQALHGSYEVRSANISHGCVRMHVNDARWLRFNFAKIGTLVIIKPYN